MLFSNIKNEIRMALLRHAAHEADNIEIDSEGSRVVLRGVVGTWEEWNEINRAAWTTPGILDVENQIDVRWS